jgi:peptidoglycan/LPS O-acetylase OafA/YrhL
MQYYLAFPLIFLVMTRIGPIITSCLISFGVCVAWIIFGSFLASFTLPAFLLLKINLFLSGMVICAAMFCKEKYIVPYCAFALILAILPFNDAFELKPVAIRLSLAAIVLILSIHHRFRLHWGASAALCWISSRLGRGVFLWMGELSYSVYLIHILIVVPVAGYIAMKFGVSWHWWLRAAVCVLVSMPVSYGLAWVSLFVIERRGIFVGREVIKRFKSGAKVTAIAPVRARE